MEHYFEENDVETGHTLKFITTITNKKYSVLTFPPNLDTKSVSKSIFNKCFTIFKGLC